MKNKLKKLIKILFALFLGVSTFFSAPVYAQDEKVLNVGVTSFADTLEPTEQYFSWVVSRYGVGENLTYFDENGEIQPRLATEWEVSDDGLEWTFQLREGVKFSDGTDLTPELVKSSIERTFELSPRTPEFFELDSIEAIDGAVKIKTKKPVATLPGALADPLFLIVNTEADTDKFAADGPICTGPFKVESFSPGDSCTVVKNENYWQGVPQLDKVVFKVIDDQSTRSMALQSGEIDVAYNLKVENEVEFENLEGYKIERLDSLRTTLAFMNQNGPLKDKVLRQAVIRGLDRETYTQSLLEGGATAGKAPVPPTLDFGFDELNDENTYDPESAKKLLDEAGYIDTDGDGYREMPDGSPLALKYLLYTSRQELGIYAQATQDQLKDIGIKVDLETVSYEKILDIREQGEYDFMIWNVLVANTGDPENFLRENFYSKSEVSTTGYNNPEVDKLLDELSSEFDPDKRKELAVQIQQLIMDDAAAIYYGYETTLLFMKDNVENLRMYPMDYYWVTYDTNIGG